MKMIKNCISAAVPAGTWICSTRHNKICNKKGKMMMLKKSLLGVTAIVAVLLVHLVPPLYAGMPFSGTKVGYIDLGRLVKESKMGQDAMSEIEVLRQEKNILISDRLKKINAVKIDLESNGEILKDVDRKDRIDELNSMIKEYKRMVADAKEEIAKQDRELVAGILHKADDVLKKVAKKKKFSMIIKDSNVVGFLDPSVDITDDVLKELNKNSVNPNGA